VKPSLTPPSIAQALCDLDVEPFDAGLGFGVWGLGFGVWVLGFGIQGLDLGFMLRFDFCCLCYAAFCGKILFAFSFFLTALLISSRHFAMQVTHHFSQTSTLNPHIPILTHLFSHNSFSFAVAAADKALHSGAFGLRWQVRCHTKSQTSNPILKLQILTAKPPSPSPPHPPPVLGHYRNTPPLPPTHTCVVNDSVTLLPTASGTRSAAARVMTTFCGGGGVV